VNDQHHRTAWLQGVVDGFSGAEPVGAMERLAERRDPHEWERQPREVLGGGLDEGDRPDPADAACLRASASMGLPPALPPGEIRLPRRTAAEPGQV
jgi:hypothetical protein